MTKKQKRYSYGKTGSKGFDGFSRNSKGRRGSSTQQTTVVKWVMLGVIAVAFLVVGVAVACKFFFNDKALVERRLEEMSQEYYENYVYENLVNGRMSQQEIREIMDKYITRGFAAVHLRQLLAYKGGDADKGGDAGDLLKEHCDENTTSVKFYPEEPFDKKSYRIEYHYDCDF